MRVISTIAVCAAGANAYVKDQALNSRCVYLQETGSSGHGQSSPMTLNFLLMDTTILLQGL
jgi:hypothetical protein